MDAESALFGEFDEVQVAGLIDDEWPQRLLPGIFYPAGLLKDLGWPGDADRVAGLLEAKGIFQVKLLVNRVRADMVQTNDMMSVRDVQEMLGIPLLGAIPEDTQVIISTNRGEPLVLKKKLTLCRLRSSQLSD